MVTKDHAELIKSVNLFAAEWERLEGYKPAPSFFYKPAPLPRARVRARVL